ncbi:TrlF family AAA-like ATPase [Bacteroides cellulosilyticus]|uniref:TrlF family AAA-like ATPase n=1 Tax=Bacteroides cellulosilyticus TaxID=246787 RepID=UPI0032EEA72E
MYHYKGSEWNKWDLHIHTPESGMANQFGSDWDKYVQSLFKSVIANNIAAIGITDYFTIDGYKKLLTDYLSNDLKMKSLFTPAEISAIKNIAIFPNIEFRLKTIVNGSRINYHIIFSNEVAIEDIEENFLHEIEFVYEGLPFDTPNKRKLKRRNIEEHGRSIKEQQGEFKGSDFTVGCTTAVIDEQQITEILSKHKDKFEGKYIVAIPVDEDLSKISWRGQDHMVRKYFYQVANMFFATNRGTIDFGLGKKHATLEDYLNEFKTLKPCICGSDAHSLDSLCVFPNGLSCWIKAEPTFEGLMQVLYEPEERVKIQQSMPDEKNLYQIIESITLNEDGFWQGTIHLNPNLNTIIGGRSTGKSSLLKAIAAKHDATLVDEKDYIHQHLKGVKIRWKDGGDETGHKIDYYKQNYMHNIACSRKQTNELVESILRSKDSEGLLSNYSEVNTLTEREITSSVFNLFQLKKEYFQLLNNLREKGNKSGVEQQLQLLKESATTLQKSSILTETEIETYNGLLAQLSIKEKDIHLAESDIKLFQKLRTITPIIHNFEGLNSFDSLSFRTNSSEVSRLFNGLRIRTETEWTSIVDEFIDKTDAAKQQLLIEKTAILEADIYKRGEQFYKDNKELQSVLLRIKEEEKVLAEINNLETKKNSLHTQIQQFVKEIINRHIEYRKEIDKLVDSLKVEYDGLSISVTKEFQKEEMKSFLESRCNLRGIERQQYIANLVSRYDSDIETQAYTLIKDLLNEKVEFKNSYASPNVASEFFSKNWYTLSYQLSYQGDLFEMMSEGKQAFVILKLLLEFSDKKCPILIDQPEDSLDNRAIYQELVEYIKTKKKDRQIVLVTHNSNVVVSADAENVIVANQEGSNSHNYGNYKFQYINGALERTKKCNPAEAIILESQGIREHVCDILEGGKVAFEKREQKYGFGKYANSNN